MAEEKSDELPLEVDNSDKHPREVYHSELERCEGAKYSSECQVCPNGMLLVQRSRVLGPISEYDYCIMCGQVYRYLDYKKIESTFRTPNES